MGAFFAALNQGDTHALETVWPGEVVIYDPRAGEVRGHHQAGCWLRPVPTTTSNHPSNSAEVPRVKPWPAPGWGAACR
ncbi:MAG TPA: hypothetical protein VGI05_13315 [Streptosporangiaceae bacterium]